MCDWSKEFRIDQSNRCSINQYWSIAGSIRQSIIHIERCELGRPPIRVTTQIRGPHAGGGAVSVCLNNVSLFFHHQRSGGDILLQVSNSFEDVKRWDLQTCQNAFDALRLRLKANTRRPLLAGLSSAEGTVLLLDNTKKPVRHPPDTEVRISSDLSLTPQEVR